MAIKAVIFDFDGVLVESVDIKTEAFAELFKGYPAQVEEVCRYHKINGGISRQRKFRHIYKNILKKPLSKEKFDELCMRFHALVVDRVVHARFVAGAQRLLESFLGRYRMFVASGTPQEEMDEVIERRNLKKYFDGVFGSPLTKEKIIKKIMTDNKLKAGELVFVGDSVNDLNAAKKAFVRFVARVTEDFPWLDDESVTASFADLVPLPQFLETLNNKENIFAKK